MFAVVNADLRWGIGMENQLLVTIRADLQRFRRLTEGKTVILGRKTLETFPGGRPLKNRRNLILSRDTSFCVEGAEVFHDLPPLLAALPEDTTDVAVIGGASVYAALLPYCDRVFLTRTLTELPADRFFPDLDALPGWEITSQSDILEEGTIRFRYIDYVNQSQKAPQ